MTARVKISQNVDILAKVHVLLCIEKVEHCQTLRVASTLQVKMSGPFLTRKSIVWYCSGWSKMTVKSSQKNGPVCTFGSTVKTAS